MGDVPPAVLHGLMTVDQHNTLRSYFQNDQERAVRYAAKLCYNSVPLFNHLYLGYDVVPHAVKVWEAVRNYNNNLVQIARSHSKTFQFAIGMITHHVCYSTLDFKGNRYRDPRIMLLQESLDTATKTVGAIQNNLEKGGPNGLIRATFGDIKGNARKWNENTIHTGGGISRDFTLVAYGAGGAMTGAHPKLLIGDDIVSKKNSHTDHLRRDMWEWWTKTVVGMIDPKTKVFLLGTPYYHGDLYHLLEQTKRYNVVKMPALSRMPEKDDYEEIIDENGVRTGVTLTEKGRELKAIWPCPLGNGNCNFHEHPGGVEGHFEEHGEHRSPEYLIHDKFLQDPIEFSTQFMLNVMAAGDKRVDPSMMRFWVPQGDKRAGKSTKYNEHEVVEFPDADEIKMVIHAWDHAIGKKRVHDNTAFARLFRTSDNRVFVKVKAGKWGFLDAVRMMESAFVTEPYGRPHKIVTEAVGFQEAYSQYLKENSEQYLVDRIEPLKKIVDKDEHLNQSGILKAMMEGMVFFELDDEDTATEFLAFTPDESGGFHDDRVDAVAMGFSYIKDAIRRPIKVYRMRVDEGRRGFRRW